MLPRVRALRGGPCHSCLRDGGLDCKVLRVLPTGVWWPHTSPVTGKFRLTSEFTFDCVVTKRADFCSLQVFIALAATHTGHARVCCVRAVMDNSHQPEPESQGLKPLNEYTLSESSKGKPTILQQCGPDTGHRRRNPTEPFLDPLLRRCVSQQPRCITGISEGPPGHLTLGRSRRRDAPAPRRVGGGRAYRDPLLVPKNM